MAEAILFLCVFSFEICETAYNNTVLRLCVTKWDGGCLRTVGVRGCEVASVPSRLDLVREEGIAVAFDGDYDCIEHCLEGYADWHHIGH